MAPVSRPPYGFPKVFDDAEGGGGDTKFILDEVGGHGGIIVDFMLGNSDASSSTSTIQGIIKNII